MVWSISPTGEVSYANQKVLEYCGTTFDRLANNNWFGFIHPDDREETAKAFTRAINSNVAQDNTPHPTRGWGVPKVSHHGRTFARPSGRGHSLIWHQPRHR